jgi:hypothetical protein
VLWLPPPGQTTTAVNFATLAAAVGSFGATMARAAESLQQLQLALRNEPMSDAQRQEAFDGITANHRTTGNSLEQAWHEWTTYRAAAVQAEQLTGIPAEEVQRALMDVADAFRFAPPHVGRPPCSCHPLPHPAARDYRRRTKHRNRRRQHR